MLYKIGMFAQMNHVTVKTLRFYEEQGIVKQAHVDEETGYRYYTMGQMADLHQISALKQAGFTLEDIKSLKKGYKRGMVVRNTDSGEKENAAWSIDRLL